MGNGRYDGREGAAVMRDARRAMPPGRRLGVEFDLSTSEPGLFSVMKPSVPRLLFPRASDVRWI